MKRHFSILIFLLFSTQILSQDIFIYKDGSEVKVKVLRVNKNDVNYKKQSNLNGPEYTEEIKNLFMIKYKNGSKDIFSNQKKSSKTNQTKKITPSASKSTDVECEDTLVFINNKYVIKCKDSDVIIRFATSKEVKENRPSNKVSGNIFQGGCGDRPEEPGRFNNPQYKQTKAYKKYKKDLIEWKNCTGND